MYICNLSTNGGNRILLLLILELILYDNETHKFPHGERRHSMYSVCIFHENPPSLSQFLNYNINRASAH